VPTSDDAPESRPGSAPASCRRGPLSLLLQPQPLPLGVGIAVATAFIIGETVVVAWFQGPGSEKSFRALFLLGVLVMSAGWRFGLALATTLVSAAVYFYFHLDHDRSIVAHDFLALFVFLPIAFLANALGRQAFMRAAESEERRQTADASASLARKLAEEQTALRRVATQVARGATPAELYPAAVVELSGGLGVDNVALLQYESGGATVIAGCRDLHGQPTMHAGGEHLSLAGDNVSSQILLHGRPARMDSYVGATGSAAERIRSLGLHSVAGAPIFADGRVWGVLLVGSARAGALPAGTERRIEDFADLVSTAIANAEIRAELTASRARVVTAADHARQRFERDLHDGVQQHVVSLSLQLRRVEALVPPDLHELRAQVSDAVAGLGAIAAELREVSRGIHPAILSRGGLGPAIKALARRSSIPVGLDLGVHSRLPEQVEVAAYYIVAEALTNAAKHASASEVIVEAVIEAGNFRLTICDNGIGGAAVSRGSGLIGLKDRIEALGGRLDVVSPAGGGTTLTANIPCDASLR
jgi:signal transduction histidine kinase